jgi:hypothetical protein
VDELSTFVGTATLANFDGRTVQGRKALQKTQSHVQVIAVWRQQMDRLRQDWTLSPEQEALIAEAGESTLRPDVTDSPWARHCVM